MLPEADERIVRRNREPACVGMERYFGANHRSARSYDYVRLPSEIDEQNSDRRLCLLQNRVAIRERYETEWKERSYQAKTRHGQDDSDGARSRDQFQQPGVVHPSYASRRRFSSDGDGGERAVCTSSRHIV